MKAIISANELRTWVVIRHDDGTAEHHTTLLTPQQMLRSMTKHGWIVDPYLSRGWQVVTCGAARIVLTKIDANLIACQANAARRIMENVLGGITRPYGECLRIADSTAIKTLRRWGWVWRYGGWFDQPLADSVRALERDLDIPAGTLPGRFIYEDRFTD